MSETTPGAVLRQLQQAQAGMKKAREALRFVRGGAPPEAIRRVLGEGWASLTHTHRLLASISLEVATDEVMTRQIAVQRYATALLVRLRRLTRTGPEGDELDEDDEPDDAA